jgi:hypothetical protein
MSISSQPQISLDDFLKDITIDLSNTTTVVGAGSNPYVYDTATMSPITITTGSASTYTIGSISSIDTMSIDSSSFTFNLPEEWVDAFPDWHRVEAMCKKYPGLEIAFRNFQTVYQLVKDDYDNPVPKK